MSVDRKSLLYLIIIMCILWIASLVVVLKVPQETVKQENPVFPVASPTAYKPPTPTNTRVLLMLELTPGQIEVIEMLPTLPVDPNFTPVPGVTSNAIQIPAPIDVRELDVYQKMQR
jgi:predicted secreted protein